MPKRAAGLRLPPAQIPKPPFGRKRHPFFMHGMIRSQGEAVRRTLRPIVSLADRLPEPPHRGRTLLTGMGTSFHAALATAQAFNAVVGGERSAEAFAAFDLWENPGLMAGASLAIAYSESGTTWMTLRALEAVHARRIPAILITAAPKAPAARRWARVLATQGARESSWTHTASLTAALAASYALIARWAGRGIAAFDHLARVPEAVEEAVAGFERPMREMAAGLRGVSKAVVLGSSFGDPIAREGALKLREAAGLGVATCGIEEFLHGFLPSVDGETAVIAVAESPAQLLRARQALASALEVGAETLLFDAVSEETRRGPVEFSLPPIYAPFSAAPHVVPFQWLAYWLAVARRRNPDVMALDRKPYFAARSSFGI